MLESLEAPRGWLRAGADGGDDPGLLGDALALLDKAVALLPKPGLLHNRAVLLARMGRKAGQVPPSSYIYYLIYIYI